MLDRHMPALQNRILDRPAARLARLGVPADAVTIVGFSVGLVSAAFLWAQAYGAALACILLNRLLDGLDGAIARAVGPTVAPSSISRSICSSMPRCRLALRWPTRQPML